MPNVEAVEPQHRGGDLPAEVGRHQHDAHVGGDHRILLTIAGVEEGGELGAGVHRLAGAVAGAVGGVCRRHLGEAHGGDHGCVAGGLELHVAAGLVPLEFDHHQVAGAIESEEVDAPAGDLPVAELLGDDQEVLTQR